jgi:hypothetical protein
MMAYPSVRTPSTRRAAIDSGWLAAKRLGSTAEVVRYRAIRGKWPRMRGNDGRARVQVPFAAADVALAIEREKTAQAIAAFASLADRLDAMAAERAKRWWRRLAG